MDIESIQQLTQTIGALSIIFILIIGFIFFLPIIISSVRKSACRLIICILNITSIPLFFINLFIPVVIWLILMILAITSKKSIEKITPPDINIYIKGKGEK